MSLSSHSNAEDDDTSSLISCPSDDSLEDDLDSESVEEFMRAMAIPALNATSNGAEVNGAGTEQVNFLPWAFTDIMRDPTRGLQTMLSIAMAESQFGTASSSFPAPLFLGDASEIINNAFFHQPPTDYRKNDTLTCPTCMKVHFPVEGTAKIETARPSQCLNENDDHGADQLAEASSESDSDEESMPPLEEIGSGERGRGDSSDEDSMPPLEGRTSEDDSTVSSAPSSMPSLEDRNAGEEAEVIPNVEATLQESNNRGDRGEQEASSPVTHLRIYSSLRVFVSARCPICLCE